MRRHSVMIGVAFVLAALAAPAQADFEAHHSFGSDELVVRNLIGQVRIEGYGGSTFEVSVKVQGRDATPERVHIEEQGGGLNVVFPVDESNHFVYPRLGKDSKSSFSVSEGGSGWLSSVLRGLLGGGRVTMSGSGSGLEIWADVEVRVPRGGELTIKHGVGEIHAENVDGGLALDNSSGSVEVNGVRGGLNVDTGSGHVAVSDVTGELTIDTGSGRVEARRCAGEQISIDTGSGGVTLARVSGGHLNVDTGSGSVEASEIEADSAMIDTGSGSVKLQLNRMGHGKFEVDTGSGSITLSMPGDASANVYASSGNGGIDLDLEGIELRRRERDEVSFSVGGGDARVTLDTGSGGIRITGTR